MSDPNILPKVTSDEIDPKEKLEDANSRDRDLEDNRPPHHEG